ncbi:MAG TPA: lamin tail domain-containing protein, partial [Anaerolineae bacterium]|nr:lamin tail domain-containing protein [Anaerolineae bacterium]
MKLTRALLVTFIGFVAVSGLLLILIPAQAAPLRTTAQLALEVVINEVAWGGTAANANHEWIELKNNTTATVNLAGWHLYGTGGATPPNIILSGTIPISGYFLLERATDTAVSDISADQIYPVGTLLNSGAVLTLTDSLSNVIDTANGNGGAWPGGSGSPNYYSMERIDPLSPDTDSNWASNDGITRNGLDANSNPITGTPKQQNSVYAPYVPPPPLTPPGSVLISAVHFSAYANGDEGFRLTNVTTQVITLTNWIAHDNSQSLPLTGTLDPSQSIWLAKRAITFTQQFGSKPDYEYELDSDPSVPNLPVIGSIPALSADDALAIREGASNWIDGVVWGNGHISDTGWFTGWIGSNLYPYTGTLSASGDIIYRKLDETSGSIITDTGTALDWANDRTDPISGRKVMYPGWDLEKFWQTAKVTATSHLTVAIAPDNAFRVISDFLGSAQHSIKIEIYSFDNVGLVAAITRTLQRGVSVTILMEGSPVGGLPDEEKWVCQQIEGAGGQCWFMIGDSAQKIHDRYDYIHAKMTIIDDQVVAIGSENFSPRSLPNDDFSDGTLGQRGTYLITDAPGVVTRALEIWNTDFDPIHHRDIYRWTSGDPNYGAPPIQFTPVYSTGGTGYRIYFPTPRHRSNCWRLHGSPTRHRPIKRE